MLPPKMFTRPFRSYTRFYFTVANLLAHNNKSQICYCGQISLQSAAVNCSFTDNMTDLRGVLFILLVMATYSKQFDNKMYLGVTILERSLIGANQQQQHECIVLWCTKLFFIEDSSSGLIILKVSNNIHLPEFLNFK